MRVWKSIAVIGLFMTAGMPAQSSGEKWAPGEFAKARRLIYDREYDRVAHLGSYARWLMEEVGTIVTAQETKEFEVLGSDAARNIFIQRFWAKRQDGSKDVHYARLREANSRWGVPGNRGFLVDRAFFFMIFGQPDRIVTGDDHSETWTYEKYPQPEGKTVKVTFQFDANGDITPDTNPFRKPQAVDSEGQ